MKLIDKYNKIQEIGTEIITPWEVMRTLGAKSMRIMGDQICLNYQTDSDYVSLEEAREAVAWYAYQLGGKIVWSKEKKNENKSN